MKKSVQKVSVIKPPGLVAGDLIGIISPAGPVNKPDLQAGLKKLKTSGFKIRIAPHVYNTKGYLAGEDEARLDDLHAMFRNQDIKAVLCARGGYGSMRLLEGIQYDLIRNNPKIFVGYSDITALLMAFHTMTGLITFHGPMVREFATGLHDNWVDMLHLFSSNNPFQLDISDGAVLIPGRAAGTLIGGNLSMLCHLAGTPFLSFFDGCILFVEEKGEPLYRIDRMLTHLTLTDMLKGLSAIIAGTFEECGDISAIDDLLKKMALDLNIPLVTRLPVGHGQKNQTLPLGLTAELDTNLKTLSIMEVCFKE